MFHSRGNPFDSSQNILLKRIFFIYLFLDKSSIIAGVFWETTSPNPSKPLLSKSTPHAKVIPSAIFSKYIVSKNISYILLDNK